MNGNRMCARWDLLTTFWSEDFKRLDHSEDLGVDERIILKWILNILWVCGQDSFGPGWYHWGAGFL